MNKLTLSLNPTYLCNFRCHFCYLTPSQLADKQKLDLTLLQTKLDEIKYNGFVVDHVDLYGGEIGLLPLDYLKEVDKILYDSFDPSINVVTNLSKIHPYFLEEHVELSVSFDFSVRELSDVVLSNMAMTDKEISVLLLASPELLRLDVQTMVQTFNSLQNIKSVEIKPYSSNQANQLQVEYLEFEGFIKEWLSYSDLMRFEFVNLEQIELAKEKKRNAFSDDHVYLTPTGNFAVLEFDENNNEFFLELETFGGYIDWAKNEKHRLEENLVCSSCDYFGHCLTEHYKPAEKKAHSCNGFYNLLTK